MFCYYISNIAELLTRLFKKNILLDYSSKQRKAFEGLKKLATEVPVLTFFIPRRPTKVETDASCNATRGVI